MNSAPYQGHSGNDTLCQYGFTDTGTGWGYTWGMAQAFGISCGAGTITGVGAYCEFIVQAGTVNIFVYDNGSLVGGPYPVSPVAGNNDWSIPPTNVSGTACIMLIPVDPFWAVTGEDQIDPPFMNTYFGDYSSVCLNMFTAQNLTIWAHIGGTVPVKEMTWGAIRAMYR